MCFNLNQVLNPTCAPLLLNELLEVVLAWFEEWAPD